MGRNRGSALVDVIRNRKIEDIEVSFMVIHKKPNASPSIAAVYFNKDTSKTFYLDLETLIIWRGK